MIDAELEPISLSEREGSNILVALLMHGLELERLAEVALSNEDDEAWKGMMETIEHNQALIEKVTGCIPAQLKTVQ